MMEVLLVDLNTTSQEIMFTSLEMQVCSLGELLDVEMNVDCIDA